MPFTPLHMGPGMALKAAIPRHFSIVVFGLTQIALDLEVLWYLIRWDPPLHRFWHTYLGATIIAVVMTGLGKPASQRITMLWNRIAAKCSDADLSVTVRTTWLSSFTGAVLGAYSHILIDSLSHPDIEPLQPWSPSNRLRGVIDPHVVEMLCVLLGIVGIVWFLMRERERRKVNRPMQMGRHPRA